MAWQLDSVEAVFGVLVDDVVVAGLCVLLRSHFDSRLDFAGLHGFVDALEDGNAPAAARTGPQTFGKLACPGRHVSPCIVVQLAEGDMVAVTDLVVGTHGYIIRDRVASALAPGGKQGGTCQSRISRSPFFQGSPAPSPICSG